MTDATPTNDDHLARRLDRLERANRRWRRAAAGAVALRGVALLTGQGGDTTVRGANLLVDAAAGRLRVADFGLAQARCVVRLTGTGALLGTPAYMAPEQLLARRDAVGPPADVWALGVVLYEALTGRRPVETASLRELVERVTGGDFPGPRSLAPDVPADLDAVCRRALAVDAADRFPDGEALAQALDGVLGPARPSGRAVPPTLADPDPATAPPPPLAETAPGPPGTEPLRDRRRRRADPPRPLRPHRPARPRGIRHRLPRPRRAPRPRRGRQAPPRPRRAGPPSLPPRGPGLRAPPPPAPGAPIRQRRGRPRPALPRHGARPRRAPPRRGRPRRPAPGGGPRTRRGPGRRLRPRRGRPPPRPQAGEILGAAGRGGPGRRRGRPAPRRRPLPVRADAVGGAGRRLPLPGEARSGGGRLRPGDRARPHQRAAWGGRGGARAGQADLEAARADLDRAIALGGDAVAYANRARVRLDAGGDPAAALPDAERALELAPGLLQAHHRGLARERTGDVAGARVDYARVLEGALPGHASALEARARLEVLGPPPP